LVALSPFITVIAFISIGMTTHIWHPTWLIFFFIPMSAILSERKAVLVALSPFLSVIAFILMGYYYGNYDVAWLVFLSIPMLGLLTKPNFKTITVFLSFAAAIVFYLIMYLVYDNLFIAILGFALPAIVGIIFGDLKVGCGIRRLGGARGGVYLSAFILLLLGFLAGGYFLPNGCAYSWQLLLFIPIIAIILSGNFRWVAIMPFLSVMIFFSVGYFFNLFELSWLAFFLIPITGVLDTGRDKYKIKFNNDDEDDED